MVATTDLAQMRRSGIWRWWKSGAVRRSDHRRMVDAEALGDVGRRAVPRSAFRVPTFMYIELHCHSAFSFLDGASLPEQLALTASQLGYPALALTDHNGLYGSMAFAHASQKLG